MEASASARVGSSIAATVGGLGVARGAAGERRSSIAIMTDCKGAFAFGYELDIGGAQAALSQYAGAKPKNKKKPSAGITGGTAGGTSIKIVGYGCGDETPALALKETRRLMEQLRRDVMIGPLSGDEAVAIANWAKGNPKKTVIIGTAGSQDPTMQIAPKNLFRYHGDGAQWNAGLGEIVYKKLGWRKAAIIRDDYSFAWTSGGRHHRRLLRHRRQDHEARVPAAQHGATTRRTSASCRRPTRSTATSGSSAASGTGAALKAYEQAYGPLDPKKLSGNLFLFFLGNCAKTVAPQLVGAYFGGFGTCQPGLKTTQAREYVAAVGEVVPGVADVDDGFFYNYCNAAWALVQGLHEVGRRRSGRRSRRAAARRSGRLPGRQQGVAQARQPTPGDPGPVPAADRQGQGRQATHRSRATCRTSTRRSAACSDRTSRPLAGTSRPA